MSEPTYLLIKPGAEGAHLVWLDADGLRGLLHDPTAYAGVGQFLEEFPRVGREFNYDGDPAYWDAKWGLLLKVEVAVPEPSGYRLPEGM